MPRKNKHTNGFLADNTPGIHLFWNRLLTIKKLQFTSDSKIHSGWEGSATGIVKIMSPNDSEIVFHETGTFTTLAGDDLSFKNTFRWIRINDNIRLEHLRFGVNHPVFLFDIAWVRGASFNSVHPHICSQDRYDCTLELLQDSFEMNWTIQGPHKNERICYTYQ